jgi:hypothetical protein
MGQKVKRDGVRSSQSGVENLAGLDAQRTRLRLAALPHEGREEARSAGEEGPE